MTEHRALQTLSRAESLELLVTTWIGRVIMTSNAMPTAMPVNFVLDEGAIVFRSGPGIKLTAAESGTVVAFEADFFDPELEMGWSVLVTGLARRITKPAELAHAESLRIPTWVEPTNETGFARIEAGVVSGRRIVPVAPAMQV